MFISSFVLFIFSFLCVTRVEGAWFWFASPANFVFPNTPSRRALLFSVLDFNFHVNLVASELIPKPVLAWICGWLRLQISRGTWSSTQKVTENLKSVLVWGVLYWTTLVMISKASRSLLMVKWGVRTERPSRSERRSPLALPSAACFPRERRGDAV